MLGGKVKNLHFMLILAQAILEFVWISFSTKNAEVPKKLEGNEKENKGDHEGSRKKSKQTMLDSSCNQSYVCYSVVLL